MGMELKNVKSPKGLKTSDIIEKFETTIEHFMKEEFKALSFIPTYSEVHDEVRIVCFKK